MNPFIPVTKDDCEERHVPTAWRMTLTEMVDAFQRDNFTLEGIARVTKLSSHEARRISGNISAYGTRLGPLPDSAWSTSVCRWMDGYWDVLVDLFAADGDETDLVLHCRVEEEGSQYAFIVESVHVP